MISKPISKFAQQSITFQNFSLGLDLIRVVAFSEIWNQQLMAALLLYLSDTSMIALGILRERKKFTATAKEFYFVKCLKLVCT
jgi:hypothetical protein